MHNEHKWGLAQCSTWSIAACHCPHLGTRLWPLCTLGLISGARVLKIVHIEASHLMSFAVEASACSSASSVCIFWETIPYHVCKSAPLPHSGPMFGSPVFLIHPLCVLQEVFGDVAINRTVFVTLATDGFLDFVNNSILHFRKVQDPQMAMIHVS